MFFKKKQQPTEIYDKENWKPILKCSICNGEQVAGFKNIHTGEFREEMFIRNGEDLESFQQKYGITEISKEY
ncbi:MAG: aspartate dehydrogenase [Lachnospiraceae bacterium]